LGTPAAEGLLLLLLLLLLLCAVVSLLHLQRKVKAAGKGTAAGGDGAGTSKAAGDKNTLKKGRNQAR
jgi:preprotein translocase subunit SecG